MPFKSKAQQRFMFAAHPGIAKRWAKEMEDKGQSLKRLPEKKKKTIRESISNIGSALLGLKLLK